MSQYPFGRGCETVGRVRETVVRGLKKVGIKRKTVVRGCETDVDREWTG